MPNTHSTLTSLFSDIADAIRAKTGDNSTIVADAFPTAIAGISSGGLEHVTSLTKQTVKLADTDFATWTPSTTAKAILATASAGTFTATDIATNDYFLRTRIFFNAVYNEGTSTAKGMLTKMCAENWYCVSRRASNNANLNSGTRNVNVAESITNYYVEQYYNGGWVGSYSSGYGIYPANSAPSFSSTSAASPTVTFNRPIINARCNATYFATGMANALDKDKSTITFVFDVYKATDLYCRHELHESLIDMWNNGLS